MKLIWIGLGGAVGTLLRYAVAQWARRSIGETHVGTLLVNVLGCLVLGFVSEAVLRGVRVSDELRLAISVGLCGGLTTYSTFNHEALGMLRAHQPLHCVAYVTLTVGLCAGASFLGLVVARYATP